MKEYKKWHYMKIQPAMALVTLESGEHRNRPRSAVLPLCNNLLKQLYNHLVVTQKKDEIINHS